MLKKYFPITLAFACLFGSVGCKKMVETATGLSYEVRKEGKNDSLPQNGDVIETVFELYVKSKGKDSLLISSATVPNRMMVRDTASYVGSFEEYFKKLSPGDSVTLWFSVDSLFAKQFGRELPEFIDKGTKARLELSLTKIISKVEVDKMIAEQKAAQENQQKMQEEQMKKMQEDGEKQKPLDEAKLKEFMAKNKLKFQKTETGLYYVVKSVGKGAKVEKGDMVSVDYVGTLFDGGKEFDTSIGKAPLKYNALSGQMIPGFDEGVGFLTEGTKADLYLPSHLAYAGMGQNGIPPFSILKFEVNLLKVEKTK